MMAAQRKIDLVVLDIMLPTMTGLSVLHEIRKKSSVPILMLTAIKDEYTQFAYLRKCSQKPFQIFWQMLLLTLFPEEQYLFILMAVI